MPSLKNIKLTISDELIAFETHFKEAMKSKIPLLDKILTYVAKRKGKQLRPMFVFLSARACGKTNESTYVAASLVELLHTATLVHDDVVDQSEKRRGFFSVFALWKTKIAVLVGDYLFSRGLLLALDTNEYNLLQIYSKAVKQMIEGEMLQSEKARKLDIDEAVYYNIIRQKTASLIAAACESGAASTTDDSKLIEKMRLFGEKIGMAFQIKDDLFDYGSDDVGKPLGIDIKEKKMTLPLIYALKKANWKQKQMILFHIKWKNKNQKSIKKVIDFVNESGGMQYAFDKMQAFKLEAKEIVDQLPPSDIKPTLYELVAFITNRNK